VGGGRGGGGGPPPPPPQKSTELGDGVATPPGISVSLFRPSLPETHLARPFLFSVIY